MLSDFQHLNQAISGCSDVSKDFSLDDLRDGLVEHHPEIEIKLNTVRRNKWTDFEVILSFQQAKIRFDITTDGAVFNSYKSWVFINNVMYHYFVGAREGCIIKHCELADKDVYAKEIKAIYDAVVNAC